jgi:hypothetical protein
MNRYAFFLAWALVTASSAAAAQQTDKITVDQLSHLLESAHGEKDSRFARRHSMLELTERPAPATLTHWNAEIGGKQARMALTELADTSVFLDPPSSQMLNLPQASPPKLRRIIQHAIAFVQQTSPRLPDFYATRTTTHFEQAPVRALDWPSFCENAKHAALGSGCFTMGAGKSQPSRAGIGPLRETGEISEIVTYVNGQEVASNEQARAISPLKFLGLVTTGEFGSILSVVLSDAQRGNISWGWWERGASGPLAVLRYRVASKDSHYVVGYPSETGQQNLQPAYHGEIAIDPATGAIWRIAVIGDLESSQQDFSTAVMVEYGPVTFGATAYMCPVRSVAFSKMPVFARRAGKEVKLPKRQTRLNDIRFSEYHLFRGDMKILTEAVPAS